MYIMTAESIFSMLYRNIHMPLFLSLESLILIERRIFLLFVDDNSKKKISANPLFFFKYHLQIEIL